MSEKVESLRRRIEEVKQERRSVNDEREELIRAIKNHAKNQKYELNS